MKRNFLRSVYALIFVVVIAAVFLPLMTTGVPPDRDSGAFLHIGQRVLEGAIPYRDIWDHKGPAVFYINALGLYLSGGHEWGVWLLEVTSLSLAGLLGFASLRHAYGTAAALFGTSMWMLSIIPVFGVYAGGNFVEQWALPLQFGALYLFVSGSEWTTGKPILWRTILIGCLGASAFLLRPNLIGVWIAIWICWMVADWRSGLLRTFYLFLAVSAILGAVSIYFASHQAFSQIWDAAFAYNIAYSSASGNWKRIRAILRGMGVVQGWPLAAGSWVLALYTGAFKHRKPDASPNLLWLAVLLLPIEMALTGVSGRNYPHYYLAWLPAVAMLTGYFAWWLMHLTQQEGIEAATGYDRSSHFRAASARIFLFTLTVGTALALLPAWQAAADRSKTKSRTFEVAEFVKSETSTEDTILVWGAEGYIYYLSGRRSPTRFFYQYPLVTAGYTNDSLGREFVAAFRQHLPRIIIDTKNPLLPPLSTTERTGWQQGESGYSTLPSSMEPFFSLLDQNYIHVRDFSDWAIYMLRKE